MRVALVAAVLVLAVCCLVLAAAPRRPAPADLAARPEGAAPKAFDWTSAEHVFTGRLDQVVAGPVGMSYPPMYTHTLHFTVEKVLRGTLKAGDKVTCSHIARQTNEPVFPMGRVCLVGAAKAQDTLTALRVEQSGAELLAQVTAACAMPLGWRIEGGKPVSPWAAFGNKAWPATATTATDAKVVCSKTGRPALMAGDQVVLDVFPVPPKVAIQWTNPDGDGEYTISVTNTTDRPAVVPALLSSGGKILWEESLVILCQDKAYACPGAKGMAGKVEPTTLAPRQSVSTVVNVLRLQGPEWPQGGYRIEFQFCLGEKGKTQSLYYMAKHHDKLREELGKPAAPEGTPAPAKQPAADATKDKPKDPAAVAGAVEFKPPAWLPGAVVDGHSSRDSVDWSGIYKGIVPGANSDIETEIRLGKNMTFTVRTRYLGKDDKTVFEAKGMFIWDEKGSVITLVGREGGPTKYQVGELGLTQLDLEGNRIAGPLAEKHVLKKQ